jgi:hypothetical protein
LTPEFEGIFREWVGARASAVGYRCFGVSHDRYLEVSLDALNKCAELSGAAYAWQVGTGRDGHVGLEGYMLLQGINQNFKPSC